MDTHTHTHQRRNKNISGRAYTVDLYHRSVVDVIHLIPERSSVCFLFSILLLVQTCGESHRLSLIHHLLRLCPAGHLLGLSHDDSKFCEERFGVNSDKRLMSSILTSIDASKPWSRCTSATITDFFDDGNGECGRKRGNNESARVSACGSANICGSF